MRDLFDAEFFEPGVDFGSTAVDEHDADSDQGEKQDVSDDAFGGLGRSHCAAAELHHEGVALELLDVWQGLVEDVAANIGHKNSMTGYQSC